MRTIIGYNTFMQERQSGGDGYDTHVEGGSHVERREGSADTPDVVLFQREGIELGPAQHRLLDAVEEYRRSHPGETITLSQQNLAAAIGVIPQRVSQIIGALAKKGIEVPEYVTMDEKMRRGSEKKKKEREDVMKRQEQRRLRKTEQ